MMDRESSDIRIAVAGNPNVGKTTLLNALTGSRQRVGNWPGVTVEKLVGLYRQDGRSVHVTDLPGIYSFTAFSMDETIARRFILEERPDVIVNILDATNLERNLFLTTQLLEMKVPMVVALNMVDLARRRRIHVEVDHLARHLGCPVVPIVASRGEGLDNLRAAILDIADTGRVPSTDVAYDSELEEAVEPLMRSVAGIAGERGVDARWLALRLLEGDEYARSLCGDRVPEDILERETSRVERHVGDEMDIILADGRYGFIHGLARDVINRTDEIRRTVSDRLDRVMLNRVLGIPIFLGIMYLVFVGTIQLGNPFIDFFDMLFGTILVDGLGVLLTSIGSPDFLVALLADGVGGGLQTVATFIPPIFLIFLFLSILEDSGYMARAAFVMDRLLRAVGLPGKAFIPMLVGFGCNVPAIMATRTLENDRDRILTIMMNPFMSCGARLPVYALFVAAFFPGGGGIVLFSLYMTGILLAIATGLLLKRTILRGEVSTFVMELPPYHMPTVNGIMHHTLTRLRDFMLRAGKVIVVVVVLLTLLSSVGTDLSFGVTDPEDSLLATVSRAISPVFRPMGISGDNWPAAVGLFSGIFAKEAVIGSLDNLYSTMHGQPPADPEGEVFDLWEGIGEAFAAIPEGFADLGRGVSDPVEEAPGSGGEGTEQLGVSAGTFDAMRRHFDGPLGAYTYLLFVLIYAPCVAVMATIYREAGPRWAVLSTLYLTALAWIVSTIFYQLATIESHPLSSLVWVGIGVAGLLGIWASLRALGRSGRMAA